MSGYGDGLYGTGLYSDSIWGDTDNEGGRLGDGTLGSGVLGDPLLGYNPAEGEIDTGIVLPVSEAYLENPDDATDRFWLFPTLDRDGLWLTSFDLGFPDIRETVEDRPDVNGVDDRTRLFGARTVTLTGWTASRATSEALRSWFNPRKRPLLVYKPQGEDARRRLQLRPSSHSAPLMTMQRRGVIEVNAQWRAPLGIEESAVTHAVTVLPSKPESGITFPLEFPLTFGGGQQGTSTLVNLGNADAGLRVRVHGPCTNPRLELVDTAESITFDQQGGLTIPAGDWLDIDMYERTARLNGQVQLSRLGWIDWQTTSWWQLPAGSSTVRFAPTSHEPPCQAELMWRSAWI